MSQRCSDRILTTTNQIHEIQEASALQEQQHSPPHPRGTGRSRIAAAPPPPRDSRRSRPGPGANLRTPGSGWDLRTLRPRTPANCPNRHSEGRRRGLRQQRSRACQNHVSMGNVVFLILASIFKVVLNGKCHQGAHVAHFGDP